jgi:lysozyme
MRVVGSHLGNGWRLAITLLVVLVSVGWSATASGATPRGWPTLHRGESYGLDVASYQGDVQWPVLAARHISFAYIKATQGTTYVDPDFATDWRGAKEARLPHGAYQFFSLCSSGRAQARTFLATVPRDRGALPAAVDLELAGNCAARPCRSTVAAQLATLIASVRRATGKPVVLYVGRDFAARYHSAIPGRDPLWLRRAARPSSRSVVIWQSVQTVQLAGIPEPVDLDLTRLSELRRLRA